MKKLNTMIFFLIGGMFEEMRIVTSSNYFFLFSLHKKFQSTVYIMYATEKLRFSRRRRLLG